MPGTALIEVWIEQINAKEAALIMNEILDQYLDDEQRRAATPSIDHQQILGQLRVRYENKIQELNRTIAMRGAQVAQGEESAAMDMDPLRAERDHYHELLMRVRDQLDQLVARDVFNRPIFWRSRAVSIDD